MYVYVCMCLVYVCVCVPVSVCMYTHSIMKYLCERGGKKLLMLSDKVRMHVQVVDIAYSRLLVCVCVCVRCVCKSRRK